LQRNDSIKKHHVIEKEETIEPPPITPRISGRSPSPTKSLIHQPIIHSNLTNRSSLTIDMYLPDYCPLTKMELKSNPNMLKNYQETVRKMFNSQLDDIGIYPVSFLNYINNKKKIKNILKYRMINYCQKMILK
jgi:hypothetical protein